MATAPAVTVAALDVLEGDWQRKRAAPGPLHFASRQQQALAATPDGAYFRYVPCPLCGSDEYALFHAQVCRGRRGWRARLGDALAAMVGRPAAVALLSALLRRRVALGSSAYAVMQCPQCRFFFRNPTYTERGLDRAYNSGGYSSFLTGAYSEERRELYAYLYERMGVERRAAGFATRRLLDFGCGYGLFLDFMRARGWDPHGFDFAADSVELGRRAFGLEQIRSGTLDERTFEKPFDAVSLISVAAHLTDPRDTFRRVHSVLRPGGLLLVWTVNANSFTHRWRRADWGGFTANHLIFFDRDSMTRALTQAGFAKVEFGHDDRQLDYLAKQGRLAEADRAAVAARFQADSLGDMLAVVATRGP